MSGKTKKIKKYLKKIEKMLAKSSIRFIIISVIRLFFSSYSVLVVVRQ
jgi:hypothetical protein